MCVCCSIWLSSFLSPTLRHQDSSPGLSPLAHGLRSSLSYTTLQGVRINIDKSHQPPPPNFQKIQNVARGFINPKLPSTLLTRTKPFSAPLPNSAIENKRFRLTRPLTSKPSHLLTFTNHIPTKLSINLFSILFRTMLRFFIIVIPEIMAVTTWGEGV